MMRPTADPHTPFLQAYLHEYQRREGRVPRYVPEFEGAAESGTPDLVYPVSEAVFIHIHPVGNALQYDVIEPPLFPHEAALVRRIQDQIFAAAIRQNRQRDALHLEQELGALFDRVTSANGSGHVSVPPERLAPLRYHVLREIARFGPLEPLTLDPHIEDVQAVGTSVIHVVHKHYGMLPTNVRFPDLASIDAYLRNLSERIGRPVSDAHPIVDATLPEGSRINIVYSEDVSRRGPSFSLRRAQSEPASITRLISWKTLSPQMAAYLWLCLEHNMSIFVCGEAACGKSTTLNAMLSFIDARAKVFSAEDTPEVSPPHQVWQRTLTREVGPDETRVHMFDLLKAALRSRPNYIVVGEIRGAEGAVAFQAMQTGHPTVATFHAENRVKMIQRLTAEPINIPVTFIDNLNVAVFQTSVARNGHVVRRIVAIDEIEGYSEFDGGVVTRPAFTYDVAKDEHAFKAFNNSHILERKVAEQHGWKEPRLVYSELARRSAFLSGMVQNRVFAAADVNRAIVQYRDQGYESLERGVAAWSS